MAEFQEVMRQGNRMCKEYAECVECPMYRYIDENGEICPFESNYGLAKLESIVMDWAEKHPEPKYPTWTEWLRTFSAKGVDLYEPIPADNAEQLGINQIGGMSDA